MEVESAELASDVDDFSDEEQAGDFAGLHGAGMQFVGVDAASSDLGFSVALGFFRFHFPVVEIAFGFGKDAGGVAREWVRFQPSIRQTAGHNFTQQRFPGRLITHVAPPQLSTQIDAGREVDQNGFLTIPVRGYLKNCRPTKAAMREEHFFAKALLRAGRGRDDFR